jgi:hypothetical protein
MQLKLATAPLTSCLCWTHVTAYRREAARLERKRAAATAATAHATHTEAQFKANVRAPGTLAAAEVMFKWWYFAVLCLYLVSQ